MKKNKLKEVRKKQNISQGRLMGLAGVNQTRISFIENGYITGTVDERERLAKALGVSVNAVFGSEDYLEEEPEHGQHHEHPVDTVQH